MMALSADPAGSLPPWAQDLLHLWFHGLSSADWFRKSDAVDAMLAQRFGRWLKALRGRPAQEFLTSPRMALAAVLLFDQVPRNTQRGSARSFATDPLAVAITRGAIARGWHRAMDRDERQFLAMPLMHSEDIRDQRLSLAYFAKWRPGTLPFARSHWRMIARFGRFPHRNRVLGRKTTPKEQAAIDAGFSW